MGATTDGSGLSADLGARVLERLGFSAVPSADVAGLRALYRAWCERVPFDNVLKMISLRGSGGGPLPGGDASKFFEAWLAHGTGGTCWPSSNALYELVRWAGFDAKRNAGFMRDLGFVNHASVRVTVDGRDWLVDSSMLTNEPLPLGDAAFDNHDPVVPAEVERDGGTHLLWFTMLPVPAPFPCRLKPEPVDHAFYLAAYEASRERGPFNQRLYARRNRPGGVTVLVGNTRHSKTTGARESRDLSGEELCEALRFELGISGDALDRWKQSGALDASFEPPAGPKPPPVTRLPPSRR